MPTPRAMFRILSVTCLLTRKALRLIIIPEVLHKYSTYYTYELQCFENIFIIVVTVAVLRVYVCTCS